MRHLLCGLLCVAIGVIPAWSGEKTVHIVLIAKDRDHSTSTHEYISDCNILAKCLNQTQGVKAEVVNGWPKDPEKLKDVKAIVLNTRFGGNVLLDPVHKAEADALLKRGVGLTAIHWGTGAEPKFGR